MSKTLFDFTQDCRHGFHSAFNTILAKARAADIVNIQLEPGLFGYSPRTIWKRLKAIIGASQKVLITYHTVPPIAGVTPQFTARGIIDYYRAWRGNYVYSRLFREVRKRPHKFHHIVQTTREVRNFILQGLPGKTITDKPLAFVDLQQRTELVSATDRQALLERFGAKGGKLVGCFGFLSKYKGIEVAIRALTKLPEDYHLVIVGGLHPEGLARGTVEQPYVAQLIEELERFRSLAPRVHFLGALDQNEFARVMNACDAVVLAYAEVGQTSSGPAALALDLQKPLYCSRNHCFTELDKYQPGMLSFFEMGNYVELAEKILWDDAQFPARREARARYLESYSVEHRAAAYAAATRELLAGK